VKRTGHFFLILLMSVFISWMIPYKIALASKNEACFFCHDKELPEMSLEERGKMVEKSTPLQSGIDTKEYLKYTKPFADLSLSIAQERYAGSVHGDLECISCHEDIKVVPHRQHLKKPTSCSNCHDEKIGEAVKKSVHGDPAGGKKTGCIGCHDPHYGKPGEIGGNRFKVSDCLSCHESRGIDLLSIHGKLFPQPRLHLYLKGDFSEIGCVFCHVPSERKNSHQIVPARFAVRDCVKCHSAGTILSEKAAKPSGRLVDRATSTRFTNEKLMKEGQYVIGANRVPALDTIALIIIVGTFGLPIVHGGLRFITRKKGEN